MSKLLQMVLAYSVQKKITMICQMGVMGTRNSSLKWVSVRSLQWRHNEHDGVLNHQRHECLLNCLFRHIWNKTSKLRVTDFCEGNSPVTSEFPAQRASNAEKVPFDDVIMIFYIIATSPWMRYGNHPSLCCCNYRAQLDCYTVLAWCH